LEENLDKINFTYLSANPGLFKLDAYLLK